MEHISKKEILKKVRFLKLKSETFMLKQAIN